MRIRALSPEAAGRSDRAVTTPDMIKVAAAGLAIIGAGTLAARQFMKPSGEEGLKGWFYDESEKELFQAAVHSAPPIAGIGGTKGDGARAIIVACKGECGDKSKFRIAYLEKFTPELKTLFDELRAARESSKPYEGKMPAREGSYVQDNTLVRRVNEDGWHAHSSAEGKKIVVEWQSQRCPDGSKPRICAP